MHMVDKHEPHCAVSHIVETMSLEKPSATTRLARFKNMSDTYYITLKTWNMRIPIRRLGQFNYEV